jgi:lipooligosaccharide transport system permease protein
MTGLAAISGRAWLVWRRNARVYLRTWFIGALPPFLEPLTYIVAFGMGVGALVGTISVEGRPVSYMAYIAPGMIAYAIMSQAYFECTFSTFIRMYYQKTFDAIVATPCTLEDVVAGEILWGATKALIAAAIMLGLLAAFGLIALPSGLWILPLAVLGGWAFAALGLCIASRVPHIDAFNVPMFLFIFPMFALSETFFPLPATGWVRVAGTCLPLTWISRAARDAALGHPSLSAWPGLLGLALMGTFFTLLGLKLMRRRLIP